jgi:hypothetical protein
MDSAFLCKANNQIFLCPTIGYEVRILPDEFFQE